MERTVAIIKPDGVGYEYKYTKRTQDDEGEVTEEEVVTTSEQGILLRIEEAGFSVVSRKRTRLATDIASALFADDPNQDDVVAHLTSGPVVAMLLEREGALAALQDLMGPSDAAEARSEEEAKAAKAAEAASAGDGEGEGDGEDGGDGEGESSEPEYDKSQWVLRAVFGTDAVRNAIHGSSSAFAAMREAHILFPPAPVLERTVLVGGDDDVTRAQASGFVVVGRSKKAAALERHNAIVELMLLSGPDRSLNCPDSPAAAAAMLEKHFPKPLPVQRTLAMVKPGAPADAIKAAIASWGFEVLAERRTTMSLSRAEEFYEEHRGRPFFPRLTQYMSSGETTALLLAKPNAVEAWRAVIGPTQTADAKAQAPWSIRAQFGGEDGRNAVHGSDSAASADREATFFFPQHKTNPTLAGDAATEYLNANLNALLVDGLAQLCAAKPADAVSATRWLGQWLVDNNPSAPSVEEN